MTTNKLSVLIGLIGSSLLPAVAAPTIGQTDQLEKQQQQQISACVKDRIKLEIK